MTLWDENTAEIKQFPMTQEMANRLNAVEQYKHILGHNMSDKGFDRLADDLGIKDATDNISGYSTYVYYRSMGQTQLEIVASGILNWGKTNWGTEEFARAEIRYQDEL